MVSELMKFSKNRSKNRNLHQCETVVQRSGYALGQLLGCIQLEKNTPAATKQVSHLIFARARSQVSADVIIRYSIQYGIRIDEIFEKSLQKSNFTPMRNNIPAFGIRSRTAIGMYTTRTKRSRCHETSFAFVFCSCKTTSFTECHHTLQYTVQYQN